ncbi:serine/threonine-protein kinase [Actinomadura macrotermitis]|uniref:Serine/threonine-protein kinase PknD n=1 Tax=Actinomadura macrotermitis TaxID=2585200 RepID=A0A7K0C772_9ACTN|nr:serine/threonine-protein kinase [Actinomadura macrotermitis]MQY09285.1 Serine/threonine-protein kinase PknD [Actinomadura macrotermitis]
MRTLGPADPAAAGPYRLHAELGRGGMGRVLLGSAPDGRLVAVKQVHARFAADAGFRARFRREVDASRRVSGAHTAAVMDADADAETPWLASVFVNGPSLGAAVEESGPLPEESVRRLAAGLATALMEIHRTGLIHRDLKPENVLLVEDGVRVIDFGIARVAEGPEATELTRTGWVVGSPAFMSPEQAEGRELSPASDVFSLGAVLAMAATGSSPFASTSMAGALYNVVHAEPDLSALTPGLRTVVGPCLAKDPAARPTPERILALLGAVAPADRPWPPAVHRMIAAQRADIDRLLGDTDRTLVPGPAPAVPAGAGTAMLTRAPVPTALLPPSRRRTGRIVALVAVCALAIAGIGAGVYALREETAAEPNKYLKAPICAEAAGRLPLPARAKELDYYDEVSSGASTSCAWGKIFSDPKKVRIAGLTDKVHAFVSWELKRDDPGDDHEAQQQREEFREEAAKQSRATDLGFGDEAYWSAPYKTYPDPEEHCSLYVRDGNLVVHVALGGERHPASTCKAEAKTIAHAAIAAMPH